MSKKLMGLAAVAALSLAVPALAQQPAPAPSATAKKVEIPRGIFIAEQRAGEWLTRDRLIGRNVRNKDGVVIGDIEDVIHNRDGNVIGVIMGVGGVMGLGEKKIGVRISALQFTTQQDGRLLVSLPMATKEMLAAVPAYKRLEPKRGIVEKTKETVKGVTDRAKETAKDAYGKAKDAVAPAPAAAPAPATPAPAAPAPAAPATPTPAPKN